MNAENTNKLIAKYIDEFMSITKINDNLKYNETIMMYWTIFRIMNYYANRNLDKNEINQPQFSELCELLRISIIGDYYKNDLQYLVEKFENQIDLSETIQIFYEYVKETYPDNYRFISPDKVINILQNCLKIGGYRKKKISRRH
jgi:hypothetical protein